MSRIHSQHTAPDIHIATPTWRQQAACIGHRDDMFPDTNEAEIARAKKICAPCPVRDACLADALRIGDNNWGIRGGLKPCERRALANSGNTQRPPTAPPRPATLADAFLRRTSRTAEGHLVWHGAVHIKFDGARYTALQVAFIIGHGREPEGPVRRTCNVECFRSDHLTDGIIRDSTAACGSRAGYLRHRKNGEKACGPCRRANSDADNRLRRTGTTKALV
jgi:hypothetical protein